MDEVEFDLALQSVLADLHGGSEPNAATWEKYLNDAMFHAAVHIAARERLRANALSDNDAVR